MRRELRIDANDTGIDGSKWSREGRRGETLLVPGASSDLENADIEVFNIRRDSNEWSQTMLLVEYS